MGGPGLFNNDYLKRAIPAATHAAHGRRQDPRGACIESAGQLADGLMSVDPAEPRQRDVAAIRLDPDCPGGEPHRPARQVPGLEPREPNGLPSPLSAPRLGPGIQRAGQSIETRVVGLFAVGLPPWRYRVLTPIPRLAQRSQRPSLCRCQIRLTYPVGAFGSALISDRPYKCQHVIEREPGRTAMRLQQPYLGWRRIQRKPIRLRGPPCRNLKPRHERPHRQGKERSVYWARHPRCQTGPTKQARRHSTPLARRDSRSASPMPSSSV